MNLYWETMQNYLLAGYIAIDFDRKAASTTKELQGYYCLTQWNGFGLQL